MNLIKWNPFREFDSFFSPTSRFLTMPEMRNPNTEWRPLVDVTEDASEYLIKAELPEVKKNDIRITANNGYLTISGERKFEKEDKKMHTLERFYGNFERSFNLPDNVKDDEIDAEFKDGMLMVHLKKNEIPQKDQKRIEIH